MPLTQLLSKTDLSPPLISLAMLSSFPRGKPRGVQTFSLYALVGVDILVDLYRVYAKIGIVAKKSVRYGGKVMPN